METTEILGYNWKGQHLAVLVTRSQRSIGLSISGHSFGRIVQVIEKTSSGRKTAKNKQQDNRRERRLSSDLFPATYH